MSRRYQKDVDLYWTATGDFLLGDRGDLEDTKNDIARAFIQRVRTRLQSRKGDWALEQGVGADLTDIAGLPNTQATGALMEDNIRTELERDGLVRSEDLQVSVFPLGPRSLGAIVQIGGSDVGGAINISFTYNLKDNKLFVRNVT
jgi:hypothetical protein